MPGQLANLVMEHALSGSISWVPGRPRMALLGPLAEPDPAWERYEDIRDEEPFPGDGYETGGIELSGVLARTTTADDLDSVRTPLALYTAGAIVRPGNANGRLYAAVGEGWTSPKPYFPASGVTERGETVRDGSLTWADIGSSLTVFTSDPAEWVGTLSARFAVIYDGVSGWLLGILPFEVSATSAYQAFEVSPDPVLGWFWAATDG